MKSGVGGFTLVEVLVGLVLFELGLLGVAGLVAVSGRVLAQATRSERALFAAEELADSLAGAGAVSDGERAIPAGRLRWRVDGGGDGALPVLRIVAVDPEGRPVVVLHALLRGPGSDGSGEEGR